VFGLATEAMAQKGQSVAVLLHGARGGPIDFLIRNQSRFERAGFETVVASPLAPPPRPMPPISAAAGWFSWR
jgi:hypothetical protein